MRIMTLGRVAVCVVALAVAAGCGGRPDAHEIVAFCDQAASLADGTVLEDVDVTQLATGPDADLPAAIDAVEALATADPPREVAEPWAAAVDPLAALLVGLRDADPSSATDTDRLRVLADALAAPEVAEAGAAVDAYVAEHC